MTIHEQFLELAAAEVDFPLTTDERDALQHHLETCTACRRRATAIRADGRSVAALPMHPIGDLQAERVRRHLARRGTQGLPTLRLALVAALLALAAMSAIAVGAQLLLRLQADDLSVVPPPSAELATSNDPLTSPSPAPTPTAAAEASPPASQAAPAFTPDAIVEVVVTGLRVRTAPTVDDSRSAKLEPLLGAGSRLQVIEGPIVADDYHWYLVQAIDLPHRGWISVADHDGSPWVQERRAIAASGPAMSPSEAALVPTLRTDAALECVSRRSGLPQGAEAGIECHVDTPTVARVGAYGFRDDRDASAAYRARLADAGVAAGSGDCRSGVAGDNAVGPTDLGRLGCFLDENGVANVRVTCGATYVGVLGKDDDLAALVRWAWWPVAPEAPGGEPPGICRAS